MKKFIIFICKLLILILPFWNSLCGDLFSSNPRQYSGDTKFSCLKDDCIEQFYDVKGLIDHLLSVHKDLTSPREDVFICIVCNKEILGKKCNLVTHIKSVHLNVRFACTWSACNRSFKRNSQLEDHIQTKHLGIPIICDKCPTMRFRTRDSLRQHIKSEHLNVIFACTWDDCDKSFKRNDELGAHLQIVHLGIPITCIKCPNIEFESLGSLRAHERKKHKRLNNFQT